AWAQVAAAMLVLGVSAGAANLNVHYDADGFTVRTGWLKSSPAVTEYVGHDVSRAETNPARDLTLSSTAPWRGDLAAVERQLRSELRSATARPVMARGDDAEIVRRVRALIADSERKEQSELALRVASVMRDVNAGRA